MRILPILTAALYRLVQSTSRAVSIAGDNWPIRVLQAGLIAGLAGAWLLRPDLSRNGLRAVYTASQNRWERLERVALVTANDAVASAEAAVTVDWTGYLFQPEARDVVFRVPAGVQSKLILDNQAIFSDTSHDEQVRIHILPGLHTLTFEVKTPTGLRRYYQAGLEWRELGGWRLAPGAYLYPDVPDLSLAQRLARREQGAAAMAILGALCGLGLTIQWAWRRRSRLSRTAPGILLIVGLAFGLRLAVLRDLTSQAGADILAVGSDQRGYQNAALDFLRGTWPQGAFYVQPGISLMLAGLYTVLGPNLRAALLVQMIGGALLTTVVFDLTRRVFDAPTGWVAGLLWAVFPLQIFYEAQALTHGLEAQAGVLLLWLWLRAMGNRQWRWLAALGLTLGMATVLRPTFLLLAPFMAFSLAQQYRYRWRSLMGRAAVLAIALILPIAPVTWHNYRAAGRFILINSSGPVTFYLGNNRDSNGLGEYTPAFQSAHSRSADYLRQTLADIGADPIRWAQLMIRKTALYLGDPELPNNVDFYRDGAAVSPLLEALPLRFGAMAALALAGAALALRRSQPGWGLRVLLIYAALQLTATVAFHVFSRFRAPLYPALAILGAWPITRMLTCLRHRWWRAVASNSLTVIVSGILIAAMPLIAEEVMSRPILRSLPPEARVLNAPIGDGLTLIGYDPLPAVEPGEPLFVTLYWQSDRPVTTDLVGTVQLIADAIHGTKVTQSDQAIGTGSYPDYPTSQWTPGQIIWDRYLLSIPGDAPTPSAPAVNVGVYHRETLQFVGSVNVGLLPITGARPLAVPPDALLVGARIGAATLAAYRVALDAQTLTLTLYWTAGEPMDKEGIVFVHLFDSAGQLVAGQDTPPRMGEYSTLAWQSGEGIVDEHRVPLPRNLAPGEYQIAVGMYDAATQSRWPIVSASGRDVPDNVLIWKANFPIAPSPLEQNP